MAKIGTYEVAGISGKKYSFDIYQYDSTWKEVAVVYVVTKRVQNPKGGGSHTNIYVGETGNLKERFGGHHKSDCFTNNGANCLSVLHESSEDRRLAIESDILDGGTWPCND